MFLTTESPDGRYVIEFYQWDQGATGTFGIRAEFNGPLWFTKDIYYERRTENADVKWLDNHTVSINGNTLDLAKGEKFGYLFKEGDG
nr:DUF5412 family protein [Gracilibacillus ureilyticus]